MFVQLVFVRTVFEGLVFGLADRVALAPDVGIADEGGVNQLVLFVLFRPGLVELGCIVQA